MKAEIEMAWDGKTLGGNIHVQRLVADFPYRDGLGWVIESTGEGEAAVVVGHKRVALSHLGRGQTYVPGHRNCPCALVDGVNSEGVPVRFVLVRAPGLRPARWETSNPADLVRHVEPVLKVEPAPLPVIAPWPLETVGDAARYRAVFDKPCPTLPNGKAMHAGQRWAHYAEVLGMSDGSGLHAKGLSMASSAILAGETDPWGGWKWKPLFPGSAELAAVEV